MKLARIIPFLLILALAACSKPIPPEKAAYVGEWRETNMYLLITQDGNVKYKRRDGSNTVSINAPIQKFDGNDFDVGIGALKTTFYVSKPPYQVNGQWKMVVDGVELIKVQ
jgi:hypothetical protein